MPDDELQHLRDTVADLTARVSKLEHSISARSFPPPPAQLQTQPSAERLESRVGLTLVNRIGAFTLAIGIIFFFKYTVDSEWVGALGRVLLGLFGGLVLTGAAEWLWRRNQRIFAQGICGCGLASIYISLYAAFAYYHLLLRPAALCAIFAAVALSVMLAFRYESSAIATLGLSISFIATAALQDVHDSRLIYLILLLLLSAASVYVSLRRNWIAPMLVTAPVSWICAWTLLHAQASGWLLAYSFTLAVVYFAASSQTPAGQVSVAAYVLGHVTLLIGLLRVLHLWAVNNVDLSDQASFVSESASVLLAVYALMMIASGVMRQRYVDRMIGLAQIALVVVKLYIYDVWLLTRFYRISAFVALGVLLLTASYVYSRFKDKLDVLLSNRESI